MPSNRPHNLKASRAQAKRRTLGWRYGWLCAGCGEVIDPTPDETGSNPMRASLDHITPVRDGGRHGLDNLRLMHACCNELRDRL